MVATRGAKPTASVVAMLVGLLVNVSIPRTTILVGAQSSTGGGYFFSPSPVVTSGGVTTGCDLAEEACIEDAPCAECVAFISGNSTERRGRRLDGDDDSDDDNDNDEPQESCASRYPMLLSGSEISFCERVGIAYCCQFTNNSVAEACLGIDMAVEVWDCYLEALECTAQEMACHPRYGETDAPTSSPTPARLTFSPTFSPSRTPTSTEDSNAALISNEFTPTATPTPAFGLTSWPAASGSTVVNSAAPSWALTSSGRRAQAGSRDLFAVSFLFCFVGTIARWYVFV